MDPRTSSPTPLITPVTSATATMSTPLAGPTDNPGSPIVFQVGVTPAFDDGVSSRSRSKATLNVDTHVTTSSQIIAEPEPEALDGGSAQISHGRLAAATLPF